MRRPRFRLRTLMVAVAVIAVVSGVIAWFNSFYQRSIVYRVQADSCARSAEEHLRQAEYLDRQVQEVREGIGIWYLADGEEKGRALAYYAERAGQEKAAAALDWSRQLYYKRLARRPWLAIVSGPPRS